MFNKNLPNFLTLTRIIVIPFIILSFYFDDKIMAHRLGAGLFLYASITDFFDGYLARKYNIESNFGKIMDPIADKILISCVLFMLVSFNKVHVFPCLLILSREIFVAGLREFLSSVKEILPVSNLAKIKTTLQMTSLFFLLIGSQGSGIYYIDFLGQLLLWLSAILTVITGYEYLQFSIKYFLN